MTRHFNRLAKVLLASAVTVLTTAFVEAKDTAVPAKAEDAVPLKAGAVLPKASLKTVDGKAFDLNAAVAKKPAVIIIYRGGWCPFCVRHLAEIKGVEKDLLSLGYQIIAISPDRPEKLKASADKNKFSYTLLSDSSMAFSRSMGIAFKLEDKLVTKYKNEYGIDVEADSGETHHQLPIPSAYIVGTDGKIAYAHVDPNYKFRVPGKELLTKAMELKK